MTPEERAATVVAELANLELLNLYPAERKDVEAPIAAAIREAEAVARREAIQECDDEGWLRHSAGCPAAYESTLECNCVLDAFKKAELTPKGRDDG